MKQKLLLLIVSLMAITFGTKAADQGKVVFTAPSDMSIYLAVDANQQTHYCTYSNEGMTYNFKVYDLDFNLEKDFSIVIPNPGEDREITTKSSKVWGLHVYIHDTENVLLTQNVFNTDDKWEVVFSQYLKPETQYGYYKFEKYMLFSESGEKITEFKANDFIPSIEADHESTFTYFFGGKQPYLCCNDVWVSFYDANTSAQYISKPTVRAFPNPLPAGRTLTISLDTPVANDSRLIISDMNGRAVYRRNVKAGTENITVPAGNLRHGMYIYNIIAGSDLLQSGKVIAE